MDELEKLRQDIDNIDRQLVSLIERRLETVLEIGHYKKTKGLAIKDSTREEEVIKNAVENLKNTALEKPLTEIFLGLMNISKEVQL